jgi:hypothetical protein
VQNQVIRYNPNSVVYNRTYINEKAKFDIQSAFLEHLSVHRLLCALTYIDLTCDPCTSITPSKEVLKALLSDLKIVELEQRQEQLKARTYQI